MPRVGFPSQFWRADHALLLGSEDGVSWREVARLSVKGVTLDASAPQWLYFALGNPPPYRHYRLTIHDDDFLSMSKLELFQYP